jgi:hypothetical protein
MRKAGGGAIVNTSAGAGMTATFGVGAYATSKWVVRGLTKTAALELARDNIRGNSIHPGNVRTPMVAGSDAAEAGAGAVRDLAISRIDEPEVITQLVLFVASGAASFSTGSEFIADGGQLLGPVPQRERAEAAVAGRTRAYTIRDMPRKEAADFDRSLCPKEMKLFRSGPTEGPKPRALFMNTSMLRFTAAMLLAMSSADQFRRQERTHVPRPALSPRRQQGASSSARIAPLRDYVAACSTGDDEAIARIVTSDAVVSTR